MAEYVSKHTGTDIDRTIDRVALNTTLQNGGASIPDAINKNNTKIGAIEAALPLKANKNEVDQQLALKANSSDVNASLNQKATKAELAEGLALKADKAYTDGEISKKANKSDVDSSLNLKANTTYVDSELSKKADTTYVNQKIADTVGAAPETLDTLKELADALGDDPNFAATMTAELGKKATTEYVNTELGKKTDKTYTDQELGRKFDKNKILPTYPSVEPVDNTTVLPAKEVFKKNAEQDTKMVQLEQDVNLMRGDVQGLTVKNQMSVDISTNVGVDNCTFSFWAKFKNTGKSDRLASLSPGAKYLVYRYDERNLFCQASDNPINLGIDDYKYNKYDIVFTKETISAYRNAVKIGEQPILTQYKSNKLYIGSNIGGYVDIYKFEKFNTALTQQQIDFLYNQGRCDEVVLGDEWRRSFFEIKNTESNISCSIENVLFNGVQSVKITQISNEGAGLGVAINGLNDNKTGYYEYLFKMYIPSESTAVRSSPTSDFTTNGKQQRIYDNVDLSKRNQWQDVRVLVYVPDTTGNGIFRAYFNYNIGDYTTIYFSDKVSVKSVDVLNEYLPSYLTKTQWIDTGVNKQDIAITAPAFTYIKPYKQYSFASGAPSTPPAAAFVEYTDVDTGNIWKSCGKRNTEQFGVQHYKQINN